MFNEPIKKIYVDAFSDCSKIAKGAVIYIKVVATNVDVKVSLVSTSYADKGKVR